jgi:hypothetical protein
MIDLQGGPLPILVTEPEPRQNLRADLQLNRQGWTLRVTDGEGRAPTGPFWGGWEARYNMGASSSALPEPSQTGGTEAVNWSVPWHEGSAGIIKGGSEVTMQLWVAARGYVPAVVTGTLPSALPTGVSGAGDTPTPKRSIPPVPTVPTGSSNAPTPTMAPDFPVVARGYWQAVPGSTLPPGKAGEIADPSWYSIDFPADGSVTVAWDNGFACPPSRASITGNMIYVPAGNGEAVFLIHDSASATVAVRQGDQIYRIELRKTRDDPRVVCY